MLRSNLQIRHSWLPGPRIQTSRIEGGVQGHFSVKSHNGQNKIVKEFFAHSRIHFDHGTPTPKFLTGFAKVIGPFPV